MKACFILIACMGATLGLPASGQAPDLRRFWTQNVQPEEVSGVQVHLTAALETAKVASLTTKEVFPNDDFTLAFDFQPIGKEIAEPHKGFLVTYLHPSRARHWEPKGFYWRVSFVRGRFFAETRQGGRVTAHSLSPPDRPLDVGYRLRIVNRRTSVGVRITEADGKPLADARLPHDDGPPVPQPIQFRVDVSFFGLEERPRAPIPSVWGPYGEDPARVPRFQAELLRQHGVTPSFGCYLRDIRWEKKTRLAPDLGRETRDEKGRAVPPSAGSGGDKGVSPYLSRLGPRLSSLIALQPPAAFSPSGEAYPLRLVSRRTPGRAAPPSAGSGQALSRLDPANLQSAIPHPQSPIEEVWRDAQGRLEVLRTYLHWPHQPFSRVRHACRNLDGQARPVDLVFEPRFTRSYGQPTHVFAFGPALMPFASPEQWRRWYEEGGYSFVYDVATQPFDFAWGIPELSWGNGQGHGVFLPALCVYNERQKGGLTLAWDNRTSFTVQADSEGVRVLKRFYLAGTRGFVDDGFDGRDGDGKIPYEVCVGYLEKPTWENLYHDYYLAAYPLYQWDQPNLSQPLPPGDFGGHEALFTSAPWTEESARMQSVEAGVRYAGLWFGHANHERLAREFNLPHTDWAHQVGMRATLQENAMVASLGGRLFDPELHYGNFPDSWVKDADGNGPFLHWEGVCVNESPRFSYGRKKLEVMKRFVEQYGFDDAYLDLYYFGPQCDYGHTYEQYPFFPFLVGLNEHLVDWAGYLHQRGMSLTLNAPHHASAWVRFGDIITADAGDLTLFPLWFKTLIGHRLNGNLGSSSWQPDPSKTVRFQGEVGRFRFHYELALFNGAFPRGHFYNSEARQWYTADANVRQAQRDLWSRNLSLAWNVAQSRLVAGEPFWHYFYLHRDGTVFLCARNGTTRREERRVPTDFRRLGWQKEGRYTVVEWNLDEGATLRSGSLPGIELSQGLPVHLEPEETKVWIITPHRPVVLTDFFAYFTLRNLYTIFSTAQLVAADERGGRAILALDAVPDRETVTRLRVGSPHRPRVTVSDAQSSEVRWVDPVTVEVRVKHRAQRGKIGIEEG